MDIISAREAFNKGLKRYFTGEKCKYGHVSERMISNGSCVECLKFRTNRDRKKIYERVRQWKANNPDKRLDQDRRYYQKNKEAVEKYHEKWRRENIEKVRESSRNSRRRMRILNPEKEKQRLKRYYERQESKRTEEAGRPRPDSCEICNTAEFRIVFDHCHASGKFRGWICDRCNRVLGSVNDSMELLKKLSEYLETSNGSKET